jgi:hypothetical protein
VKAEHAACNEQQCEGFQKGQNNGVVLKEVTMWGTFPSMKVLQHSNSTVGEIECTQKRKQNVMIESKKLFCTVFGSVLCNSVFRFSAFCIYISNSLERSD